MEPLKVNLLQAGCLDDIKATGIYAVPFGIVRCHVGHSSTLGHNHLPLCNGQRRRYRDKLFIRGRDANGKMGDVVGQRLAIVETDGTESAWIRPVIARDDVWDWGSWVKQGATGENP